MIAIEYFIFRCSMLVFRCLSINLGHSQILEYQLIEIKTDRKLTLNTIIDLHIKISNIEHRITNFEPSDGRIENSTERTKEYHEQRKLKIFKADMRYPETSG
jgi:hypothetical protein